MTTPNPPLTWVPDACTLPTAEQPPRLAEFDDLFAGLRSLDRLSAHHLRMHLSGPAGLEDTVHDLTVRENECCSFFAFTTTPVPNADGTQVTLDIQVPPAQLAVLDALARRAEMIAAQGKSS